MTAAFQRCYTCTHAFKRLCVNSGGVSKTFIKLVSITVSFCNVMRSAVCVRIALTLKILLCQRDDGF